MNKLNFVWLAMALAACSAPAPLGPQPMAQLGPALSADEARSLMVGYTGTGTRTSTGSGWNMYVAPDGTLAATAPHRAEAGRWRFADDGRFCMTWTADWDGKELCQSVHRSGGSIQLSSPASLEILTFMPGKRL